MTDASAVVENELDVRPIRKPEKHPTIFARFAALTVGEAFVLVNNHDPVHLHDEFERDLPGSYDWEYLEAGPQLWRIRISRLANTALPRIVFNSAQPADDGSADATGAVWRLQVRDRDLDSHIVALAADASIEPHTGPGIDFLVHVMTGSGTLHTETRDLPLTPGAIAWLPRLSQRSFTAGPDGLSYLQVSQRRQALTLEAR